MSTVFECLSLVVAAVVKYKEPKLLVGVTLLDYHVCTYIY